MSWPPEYRDPHRDRAVRHAQLLAAMVVGAVIVWYSYAAGWWPGWVIGGGVLVAGEILARRTR